MQHTEVDGIADKNAYKKLAPTEYVENGSTPNSFATIIYKNIVNVNVTRPKPYITNQNDQNGSPNFLNIL